MTLVSLIVAYSRNRVIGKDNQLPWKLPGDLAHFKQQTIGKPIIMGRNTWLSLGRPLPGRTNIVVSRSGQGDYAGAVHASSLEAAFQAAGDVPEIFIIGGAQLYADALTMADRIIATEIHSDIDGDARFPDLDPNMWVETERQPQPAENNLSYDFVQYRKRT